MNKKKKLNIAIIGMGYVGLPLAIAFAKKNNVIGFDINQERINQLKKNIDKTNEVDKKIIKKTKNLIFSSSINDLKYCKIYIVTVPTPVDKKNQPNMKPLLKATNLVSRVISKNNLVIYESTVYPGATEEICAPLLEKKSGLKINKNLNLGYSPERINPGDKNKKLENIVKIVSGSDKNSRIKVANLYKPIIKAGIYQAESIKIAESAKVIENTQRDINIAFVNELSLIFKKLNISTEKVLKAAETKWNFLSFRPGLVGGHCIGVDPYYLTYKSNKIGYKPKIILSGRSLNDQMAYKTFKDVEKIIKSKNLKKIKIKILIMGLSFKENCPDTRNSKVLDLYNFFKSNNYSISSYDPYFKNWSQSFNKSYNVINTLKNKKFDAVIIAVKHLQFVKLGKKINKLCSKNGFIYDLKYLLPESSKVYRL